MKPDQKRLAIGVIAVLAALMVGYLPQRGAVRQARETLEVTESRVAQLEQELAATRLASRLGAALAEAQRGNFERARQLTSSFYTDLAAVRSVRTDSLSGETMAEIESQRDDIITLLSRAVPESMQRLALITTSYYAAIDPTATTAPSLTPPPSQD